MPTKYPAVFIIYLALVSFSCAPEKSLVFYHSDYFALIPQLVETDEKVFLKYRVARSAQPPGLTSRIEDEQLLFHMSTFVTPPYTNEIKFHPLDDQQAWRALRGKAYWIDPDGIKHHLKVKTLDPP